MNQKSDDFNEIDQLLADKGLTVNDYFKHTVKRNSSLLQCPDSIHVQFSEKYCKLVEEKKFYEEYKKYNSTAQERGKMLEDLINLMFCNEGELFECGRNFRTSSNEIDVYVRWSENSNYSGIRDMYKYMGDSFLCECKNYTDPVQVTYVGKFFSLLKVADMKFGILFSINGISGKNWTYGQGLIKKIALSDKTFILDINLNDLKYIYEKKMNIFEIINNKYQSLKNDISYENLIQIHELEDDVKEYISEIQNEKAVL